MPTRNPRQGTVTVEVHTQRVRPPRPLQGRDIGAGLASEAPRDLPRRAYNGVPTIAKADKARYLVTLHMPVRPMNSIIAIQ